MPRPPDHPHDAAQQRARRLGYRILVARNFDAWRHLPSDQVVVQDGRGERVAGPFDLASANSWMSVYGTSQRGLARRTELSLEF